MQTTWNLDLITSNRSEEAIQKEQQERQAATNLFVSQWLDRQDYLEDPQVLAQALTQYEQFWHQGGTSGNADYYTELELIRDRSNSQLKALSNSLALANRRLSTELEFFELRLSKISKEKQTEFLSYPGLSQYRHFLKRIFDQAEHLLSEAEERIMTMKSTSAHTKWVQMTSEFLAKEERLVDFPEGPSLQNISSLNTLLNDPRKSVRDSAAAQLHAIYEEKHPIAVAEINAILADHQVNDELRKRDRPDQGRHLNDDISSSVVDTLIQSVSSYNRIPQEYYALKAQLLGIPQLAYHERNLRYGESEESFSYEEAVPLVEKALDKLSPQFSQIFRQFVDNGQIDVYPKKGKQSGACCIHNLITQPTYILLNYGNILNDVLTLAHEVGHGINNELVRGKQHALYFGTPLSTAEVASTFMEDFVLQELLAAAQPELKLSLLMSKLNDDISTIFRQIACYTFEQKLHQEFREKGFLDNEEIGHLFTHEMSPYMGPSVSMDKGSENWWVGWSHIRSFFYVYSYASGLLISKSLQQSVKEDPGFIEKVIQFLSTGLAKSPQEIFLDLGINIQEGAFWQKGLDEVELLLKETKALAQKLGKIS